MTATKNTESAKKVEALYGGLITELTNKVVALSKQIVGLQRLAVITCAQMSEFVEEPGVKALNFNLSRKMREILATQMPTLSESMKDE